MKWGKLGSEACLKIEVFGYCSKRSSWNCKHQTVLERRWNFDGTSISIFEVHLCISPNFECTERRRSSKSPFQIMKVAAAAKGSISLKKAWLPTLRREWSCMDNQRLEKRSNCSQFISKLSSMRRGYWRHYSSWSTLDMRIWMSEVRDRTRKTSLVKKG